jgi:hypothetical protein
MVNTIKDYYLKIKLNYELRTTERGHDRLIKQAQERKKSEREIEGMLALRYYECNEIEQSIRLLTTRTLVRTAKRLSLPIPAWKDKAMWEEDYGDRYLTTLGVQTIRKQIRDERKEKRDSWLPWVCAITGLIGALIGLISAYHKVR